MADHCNECQLHAALEERLGGFVTAISRNEVISNAILKEVNRICSVGGPIGALQERVGVVEQTARAAHDRMTAAKIGMAEMLKEIREDRKEYQGRIERIESDRIQSVAQINDRLWTVAWKAAGLALGVTTLVVAIIGLTFRLAGISI
jgi:hypothetical protein